MLPSKLILKGTEIIYILRSVAESSSSGLGTSILDGILNLELLGKGHSMFKINSVTETEHRN